MHQRETAGKILVVVGGAVLFATALLHGAGGYPSVARTLAATNLHTSQSAALGILWLLASWHWIVFGVIAVAVALRGGAVRGAVLLLCGLLALVDGVAVFRAVGLFIGDAMLGVAALAFFTGALLLRSSNSSGPK